MQSLGKRLDNEKFGSAREFVENTIIIAVK